MKEMMDSLFGSPMPPHGHCYFWNEDLVALHVGSDIAIALSYFTIPIALVYLVRKRDDLQFNYIFVLFGVFIFACGLTHVINILNVWYGAYWLAGTMKAITALASIGTAILVWPLIPKALAFPSNEQLRVLNGELKEKSDYNLKQKNELEQLSAQLELQLEQVTKVTEELEQANKELERSNDALQQFTYIASHDLKEPLRTITSMGQLLEAKVAAKLDAKETQMLGFMSTAAKRVTDLIEDLRSYAVVGSTAAKPEQADIDDVVDNVLADVAARVDDAGAVIKKAELGEGKIIPPQFQQLILNLVTNAIKFSDKDQTPEVSIGVMETGQPDQKCIFVRDNGIGIPAEYREKIFGVFQRLEGRTEYEGTGMGLAICKKIIDSHQGHIEVHDAPEGGTEFRVFIKA